MVSLQRFVDRFLPVFLARDPASRSGGRAATSRLLSSLALGTSLSLLLVSAAHAESAYDERQRKFADAVLARGKDPAAQLDLLRMVRNGDEADPAVTLASFRKVVENRAVDPQHRVFAARRVAWDLRRTGDVPGSAAAFDALGYVRAFRIVGPFDNEGKRGFTSELGPETDRLAPPSAAAVYRGRERDVRFRAMPDILQGGYLSFDAVFRPTENVCGFAETSLHADKAGPITLWLGAGGASKLYFNGVEVLSDAAYRAPSPERNVALVQAKQGENRVLVKSCVTSGSWGFYLRVGDARGEPLVLKADPSKLEAVPAPKQTKYVPAASPKSVLAVLEAEAAKPKPKAQALENLSRFLWYTGADDPAERRAQQLSRRAAELEPTAARWLLAAALADERYEKLRLVGKARALAPNDPEVVLAHAQLVSLGPSGESALALLEGLPEGGTNGLEKAKAKNALLLQLGLDDSALEVLRKAHAQAPKAEVFQSRMADALAREPRQDDLIALSRSILAERYDHLSSRRILLEDAVARDRDAEVLEHLDALRALFPGDEKRLFFVAEAYDAIGREDLRLATLKTTLEIAPESAAAHVRYGRALLRSGQTDAAAESLRAALKLQPQDAETRELLEQIVPEQRLDESFAVASEKLLERRKAKSNHPVTVLQDLTVNTVFDNGLGSRFVQFAAQVHDAEGARRLRARSIQFDPETQRVDVRLARVHRENGQVLDATETYEQQLGEPWYRVYYDTRALVVVFPDLEPGDSVELRYRVDDVAPRNLFADYYGDLHMLGGGEPRAHVEYVLITPTTREFYFNKPKLASLQHEQKIDGARRVDRFFADDVPALRSEPSMPGMTEVIPYLHVSTYKSWQDVGRWYWGLIQDQLYADDHLKSVVAELKKGAKDEREIVARIYDWVVKNTRYVALEFGIHGFLPYRVPEIVRRGFGDCKDKASLIYTMLREAGVDARIVLTRTRQNGAIDSEPASLSVFDHAIAYVPSLKLFLDGTAEHSGTRELPGGDQGVMVLLVGPSVNAELVKTPVLPPESNLRSRKLQIQLSPDGGAQVTVDEKIAGVDAARYRDTFQAEGTRKDRLERQLSNAYPGLALEQHSFKGLSSLEEDVAIDYRLKAPQVARVEGDELRIPVTSLRDLLREMAVAQSRKFPLDLSVKNAYREERTTRAPAGFVVGTVPSGGALKSRFGSLSVSSEQAGLAEVRSTSAFTLDVDRVEPADYAEFRRFIEQADDILRQRVTFVKGAK
jgi:tetratricopeptide (TPR) repeat protein